MPAHSFEHQKHIKKVFFSGVAKSSTKTAQKNHKRSTKITLYFGGVFREKLFPCINFLGVGVGGKIFFGLQKVGEFFFFFFDYQESVCAVMGSLCAEK